MSRFSVVVVVALVLSLASCSKDDGPPEGVWRPANVDAGVFGESPLTEQGKKNKLENDKRKLEKLQLGFVREPEQECKADADCVLTPRFCCGCTANGAMVGIHKDKLQDVLYRRVVACKEYVCAQAMSTDPSCEAARAVCRAGKCVPDAPAGKPGAGGLGVEPIPADGAAPTPTPTPAPKPAPATPAPAPAPTQPG